MLVHFVIGFALSELFGLFTAETNRQAFLQNDPLCLHTPDQLKLTQSQLLSHATLPDSDYCRATVAVLTCTASQVQYP